MPRSKKGPGRGRTGHPLPPRIDASPDEIASVVLGTRPKTTTPAERDYTCEGCGKKVTYPDAYHEDNRCTPCHLEHSMPTA